MAKMFRGGNAGVQNDFLLWLIRNRLKSYRTCGRGLMLRLKYAGVDT